MRKPYGQGSPPSAPAIDGYAVPEIWQKECSPTMVSLLVPARYTPEEFPARGKKGCRR